MGRKMQGNAFSKALTVYLKHQVGFEMRSLIIIALINPISLSFRTHLA